MAAPIYLILGTPASGKSTVARALMARFPRGLHLPVDDLRQMVVSGLADMGRGDAGALDTQLRLARQTATRTALAYAEAGFAVAIDDFWLEATPERHYEGLREEGPASVAHWVVLRPSLEVTLARLHARNPAEGSFKGQLAWAIRHLTGFMDAHPITGMTVVDSSTLSVEETVDELLRRTGTAPAAT